MEAFVDQLWNPYLLLGFFAVGLYLSLISKFFQRRLLFCWKSTVAQKNTGDISQISALFTALATTIGTGSIAGVATALWFGGAGAIFWMWVSAFFGMILSAVEKILTLHFRVPDPEQKNNFLGGPMYYMERGLGWKFLARLFCLGCLFSTFVGGNLLQSSSIAQGMSHLFHVPPFFTGIALLCLVCYSLRGGMTGVGKLSTKLVPIMACLYFGAGLFCILQDIPALQQAVNDIFSSVWSPQATVGGGYGFFTALRFGMARGIFSNEAGLGASAMAHGNARVDHPARQGMWGIVEVCFATLVCTLTALVILTSGIYQPEEALSHIALGEAPAIPLGVPMTQSAFSVHLGQWGSGIVLFSLILFAFTSILGWCCYGAQAIAYLCPKGKSLYTFITMGCILWGSVGDTETLWHWVDLSIAIMAVPNLMALWCLGPKAIQLLEQWTSEESKSEKKRS